MLDRVVGAVVTARFGRTRSFGRTRAASPGRLAPLHLALLLALSTPAPAAEPVCDVPGPEASAFWEIEYDLTGSEFETRNTPLGAGDATQIIRAGGMTIRFEADDDGAGGQPRDGAFAQIVQLALLQDFVVRSQTLGLRADVYTQIVSAIPDTRWDGDPQSLLAPGAGTGELHGETLTVRDPGLVGYRSVGSMLCRGWGCAMGLLPRDEPQPVDNQFDLSGLDALHFGYGGPAEGAGFYSNEIPLPTDQRAEPFLRLRGRELRRTYVPVPVREAMAPGPCYSALGGGIGLR